MNSTQLNMGWDHACQQRLGFRRVRPEDQVLPCPSPPSKVLAA